MRRWTVAQMVVGASLLAACGDQGQHGTESAARTHRRTAVQLTARQRALGLTRQLPAAYRRVCARQARAAPPAARTCPPLIPAGSLTVAYRGKSLGRDSVGGGVSADLASRSLRRLKRKRTGTEVGHWRYDVAWTPAVRHAVVATGIERPPNASPPSSCRK